MKVLALNGSPRGEKGNTEIILKEFLKGCTNAGAEVEIVYLKDKKINHCSGCFSCWTKTQGKCIHKDDMEELLTKVSESEIIVYATPLYYYTVTGIMKDFMDRMLPLNKREIVKVDEKYNHPDRIKKDFDPKVVLISNCGFPGEYNFSGLLETFNVMTNRKLAGAILCAQGGGLQAISKNEFLKKLYENFFEALKNAGEEVVKCGKIKAKTQAILDKKVVDTEDYIKGANMSWKNKEEDDYGKIN